MSETKTIYLNGKKGSCSSNSNGTGQCYQVKYTNGEFGDLTGHWGNFYDDIIGFDYEPGYVYKLLVRVDKRNEVMADESMYTYTLVEIVEKIPMPANEVHNCGCMSWV